MIGRLIGEVYANISRHASSGGKYEVSVLVKTHSLEITEVNDMGARHSRQPARGHASDSSRLKSSISEEVFPPIAENGIWMFHARIPFD